MKKHDEDGFGGPLAVYRTCKRLARLGAAAVQLEDAGDMEETTGLMPREQYYAKVRAALEALEGTDTMLIARTNADPKTQLEEGCERLRHCHEMGAELTMLVKLSTYEDAKFVAAHVPGWKAYPDVKAPGGVPEITNAQARALGFRFMTTHFVLKAAMDWEPQKYAELENRFTGGSKEYTIVGNAVDPFPEGYRSVELKDRF